MNQVQLVFRGEVLAGFQRDDVQRSLGRLLKLDDARSVHLFTGARMVLKRSLAAHDAQHYVERLAQLGARIHVEPMPAQPPTVTSPEPLPAELAPKTITPVAPPSDEEIVCPTCGERQSKRILCRSCATNMPMGIAAKLEEEQKAREARQAEFRARRGLKPVAGTVSDDEVDPHAPGMLGFGFEGRMGRLAYATANCWLMALVFLLTLNFTQLPSLGRAAFLGFGLLLVFFLSARLAVLRCHDCGLHGWWALFMLLPYAGFIASTLLSFVHGTDGPNEHGGLPRRGRGLWLAVAALVALLTFGLALASTVRLLHKEFSTAEEGDAVEEAQLPADIADVLPTFDAANAFRDEYLPARGHKAFAVSSGKSWGYKVGAASAHDAVRGALAACDAKRQPYTAPCQLVNLNGQWARMRE